MDQRSKTGAPVQDYRVLYETVPAALIVLAPDRPRFTILAVTDAYLRATRTTRDIVGRGIFEVFPDDPADPASTGGPARASFERVLETGAPDAMAVQKHSIPRPESEGGGFEARYWSPVNTPVLGESGEVLCIHHRVEDVTEFVRAKQQRAEQHAIADALRSRAGEMEADVLRRAWALQDLNRQLRSANERLAETDRAKEARLRRLYDSGMLGVCYFELSGAITEANDEFLRILGYTRSDLREGRIRWMEMTPPEFHALDARAVEQLRTTGVDTPYEKEFIGKDGSRVPVFIGAAVFDDARHSGIAFVLDMTDRKRAEEALRQSERRLREAHERLRVHVESTPLGVVEWDSEYRVAGYSGGAQEMFGWAPDEVLGKRIDEIPWVPEEDWPSVRAVMRDMASATRPTNVNANRNVRKDGAVLYCEWYNSTLYDETGRLASVLSFVLDVTERKRAEDALREADRRKDEFLGMLSHELRNPLAPIRNALYVLERAEPDGQQARRAREVATRQVAHLTRLVDDLLDVTRITRGKIELRREHLDLAVLARRSAEDYRALMQDRGLELAVDVPSRPFEVNGDPARLTQIFGNLLSNAAKFTPAGGRVTLSLREEGERAVVRVRDTGPGIAPEVLPTLFDPFTQGKQTLARSEGGLGLGLSLVKAFVALHGGDVGVSSPRTGDGAELVVSLPLATPRGPAAGEPRASPPAAPDGRRRVLVIDDNRDAADSLAALVATMGHDAEVAYDAGTALRTAGDAPPDVVLCDIGLPGMDGYELARQLRALSRGRPVRLFAVSGYAQPEDVARATEAGFDGHVAKPPDPAEIERLLA